MVAEPLERRQLLTLMHDGFTVGDTVKLGSPTQNGGEFSIGGDVGATAGSMVTVDVYVTSTFSTEFVTNTDPDPSGTVTISDLTTGRAVLTLPLTGKGYDQGTTSSGINEGSAFAAATGQVPASTASQTLVVSYAGDRW